MIYPKEYEMKIGFDRIRAQVGALCRTDRARELLADTLFSSDYHAIVAGIARCDEMRTILMMENEFPQDDFVDIQHFFHKIRLEGTFLETAELLVIRRGLTAVGDLLRFFAGKEEEKYPRLRERTRGIVSFPEIVARIDAIADKFGRVKDHASPELYEVRRAIAEREGQISKRLRQILQAGQSSGVIDPEASVSIRDGRAVIPVSAANKKRIKGFIHDESASGKTFYVEPIEVVELNNELKELEYRERREIVRILIAFADAIRPHSEEIRRAGEFLAEMDFIRAKARFALANGCVRPLINPRPGIELKNARHPLLAQALGREGKEVVPLDLTLTPEKFILVISGPNAGGKSVCLKTVGLLQFMAQCGFLIPASENSEIGVFSGIFMDIGDEQSIDNDLSTYSSHLQNMKTMLRHADGNSLVLIDEFGSGTEPVMGGAIAEALLQKLEEKRVFGVITTHYSNLKYYASNAKGILNGAMSFDVQNIRPLFRLETGKPGSSFAVEIARKIGLPEEIIRSASELAGSDHINLEKQLRQIARDKRYWEGKRDRIRIAEKKADEISRKYEAELTELKQKRNQLVKEAREEAKRLLAEANRTIENTIRVIRETQADKEKTRKAREELEGFREKFAGEDTGSSRIDAQMARLIERERRRAEKKSRKKEEEQQDRTEAERPPEPPMAGDKVKVKGQQGIGEVLRIDGKTAVVGFGQLMMTLPMDRLEKISQGEYRRAVKESQAATLFTSNYDTSKRRLNFSRQIDLRGERAADALAAVREYIDEAVMLGVEEVKILHGKGTGALKEEIRKYLRTVDVVTRAVDEDEKFGGAGITVVSLDV